MMIPARHMPSMIGRNGAAYGSSSALSLSQPNLLDNHQFQQAFQHQQQQHHDARQPRRDPHGRESVRGSVLEHRVEGRHAGGAVHRRRGELQRCIASDVSGVSGAIATGANERELLREILQAERRRDMGRRRRLAGQPPP
ncbi:hypothetical protein EE612_025698 [Oryza sativa]|nr:hypothetical protein EE612_025698 [Oryza sativa]